MVTGGLGRNRWPPEEAKARQAQGKNPTISLHFWTGVARSAGLEPATPGLGIRCSIRLSYERTLSFYAAFSQAPSRQ